MAPSSLSILLVLKCIALLAANDRAALESVCAKLYAIHPELLAQFGMMLTPASAQLAPNVKAMLSMLSAERAAIDPLLLRHLRAALLFSGPSPQRHAGLITHMASRFGQEIVPELVAQRLKDAPATARETRASSAA